MMKQILLILLMLTALNGYEYDECAPPDVYADWADPEECEDYYAEQEEENKGDENE